LPSEPSKDSVTNTDYNKMPVPEFTHAAAKWAVFFITVYDFILYLSVSVPLALTALSLPLERALPLGIILYVAVAEVLSRLFLREKNLVVKYIGLRLHDWRLAFIFVFVIALIIKAV
jgi:hypothetical protein